MDNVTKNTHDQLERTAAIADEDDDSPTKTDLVIRDGFPALRIPGTSWKPRIDGDDPIPRHSFWVHDNAIEFHPHHLHTLLEDCETVFTARDKPDGAAYSAGQTFFLPAHMKPRCALEALAQSIFRKHTDHLEDGSFDPLQSGANWWTLVLDAGTGHEGSDNDEPGDDEVGLHFDADYELEEQTSDLLLHPRVATVTYLSNFGAPTLILDQRSPPMDDEKKKTLESGISRGWLSHPKLGKHTAFDGRLLHGAPALYFPSQKSNGEVHVERTLKKQKIDRKRYTLLVNVWLNHWVMDAGLLDDEVCEKLKTPWEDLDSKGKKDPYYFAPFQWNAVDLMSPAKEVVVIPMAPVCKDRGEPAGEDELALCNHTVSISYNSTMEECHSASFAGGTVELSLEKGAIVLFVGNELPEGSSEDEAD